MQIKIGRDRWTLLVVRDLLRGRRRFAELKDPVKDRLRGYGAFERIGADAFYPTVGTAVDGYVEASGADWVDWEDRAPTT